MVGPQKKLILLVVTVMIGALLFYGMPALSLIAVIANSRGTSLAPVQEEPLLLSQILLLGAFLRSSNRTKTTTKTVHVVNEESQCSIFLAPSSLIGYSGTGVFTTRDIPRGKEVLNGPDGTSVPVEANQGPPESNKEWRKVWDNYWYGHGVPEHISYEAGFDIMDFIQGIGMLSNHHCVLNSLWDHHPDPAYDDSLVNRYKDPGTGAFSYSAGRSFTVDRNVKAGEELFIDYGHCERGHPESPEWAEHIFMTDDFKQAAKLVKDGLEFDSVGKLIPPENNKNKYVADLLPKTKDDYEKLKKSVKKSDKYIASYLAQNQGLNKRDPDWIRSNGICLLNTLPGTSTIPQAGRGAIAQYPIPKGDIVVPVPLLQISDKELLTLYDDNGNRNGTQVLLNYCFNHPESSLLLCSFSNSVLINHCSERKQQCGPEGPNAEVRWSSGWEAASDEWRKKSLEEIANEPGRGLAFEIVALRDIHPGDEVFIDYGVEWEEAWENHVANWKPPPAVDTSLLSAKAANDEGGPISDELIAGDLRETTNHPHLFTACHYFFDKKRDYGQKAYQRTENWQELDDETIIQRYGADGQEYGLDVKEFGYTDHEENSYWPCSVLKQESSDTYTVRIHQHRWHRTVPWHKNNVPRILTNYPREAIRYFVKEYQSDQHLPGVFRHPIGIPDNMYPEKWKDLKKVS